MIEIVPHRRQWPQEYARIIAGLRPALPAGATFHHIGSTAVPGLGAKDVIDVQASVDRLGDVDIVAIEALGFVHRPGLSDHLPPGTEVPRAELAKLYFRQKEGRRIHLHVRERRRFNHRYALLCRDYLRAAPETAAAYEAVKHALAPLSRFDPDAYFTVKDPVFDILMAGANLWAEQTGWREPPGD
jgi:GrpB-like predicted nucleotidyltransferase (UPF0157 family)